MTDRLDYLTGRQLQHEALRRAKVAGFPRMGAGDVIVEGREGWLRAVHKHPGLSRALIERLVERDRFQRQQGARVRLCDPSVNPYDRAIARGRGSNV